MLAKTELIIPRFDNDGSDNRTVIEAATRQMCGLFGGVTVYDAKGFWLSDASGLMADEVAVLVSAATPDTASKRALRELARMVLAATDQEAVFISDADGAEIIER